MEPSSYRFDPPGTPARPADPPAPQRRRRWPMVFGVLFLVLLGLTFLFFKDEPLREHSDLKPLPAIDNGDATYALWLEAANKIDDTTWSEAYDDPSFQYRLDAIDPWDSAMADAVLAGNDEAIALALAAAKQGDFDPPRIYQFDNFRIDTSEMLKLIRLLQVSTSEKIARGDYSAALEQVKAASQLNRSLVERNGSLIGLMVGIVAEASTANAAERLIESDAPEAILVELSRSLPDSNYPEAIAQAYRAEFEMSLEACDREKGELDDLFTGQQGAPPKSLFRPKRYLNELATIYRVLIDNASRPFSERVPPILPDAPTGTAALSKNAYGDFLLSQLQIVMILPESADYLVARRRALATKLAIIRYDRQLNRMPVRLDDLVPEFIDAIPADPFDGQAIRYDPALGTLWSVGEDGTDQGGAKAPAAKLFFKTQADPTLFIFRGTRSAP